MCVRSVTRRSVKESSLFLGVGFRIELVHMRPALVTSMILLTSPSAAGFNFIGASAIPPKLRSVESRMIVETMPSWLKKTPKMSGHAHGFHAIKRRSWNPLKKVSFLSQEAISTKAVVSGKGVLSLPEVALKPEVDQLVQVATAIACEQCEADGTNNLRMHVPKRLPSEEIAICEQIFRRALHRIDAELPGLVEALFGSGASLSELHTLDELEFSFNEPAINVYFAGGGFTPHEDSCALTVLIPLTSAADGAFAGGGTGFWGRRSSAARGDEPSLVLKPQPGTAMLFTGDVTHAGLPVATGTRVVLVASFSRRVAAGAGEMPADGVGEEQLVFEGGEQLVRKVFPGGTVQYYGGEREVQRLVRVEYPDGDVEHYGGERGAERMVRAVLSNGDVEHYEGEADSERLVRRELPNGEVHHF